MPFVASSPREYQPRRNSYQQNRTRPQTIEEERHSSSHYYGVRGHEERESRGGGRNEPSASYSSWSEQRQDAYTKEESARSYTRYEENDTLSSDMQALSFDDGRMSSHPSTSGFNEEDLTNVFSFARHNRSKDLERLLDSTGIPANVRDSFGNTILIVACQNGLKRVAKVALRRGADINARNVRTPLSFSRHHVFSLYLTPQCTIPTK